MTKVERKCPVTGVMLIKCNVKGVELVKQTQRTKDTEVHGNNKKVTAAHRMESTSVANEPGVVSSSRPPLPSRAKRKVTPKRLIQKRWALWAR